MLQLINWWQLSSPWDGLTGQPCGPPEWPRRGGILHQPAKLVEATNILRAEWSHIQHDTDGTKHPARK